MAVGPAVVVGLYTRVAGVWERVNGGTPIGFSGPQVRQGGSWSNAINVQAYNSGWNYAWVNIDGELNVQNYQAQDFDISPYIVAAWIAMNSDGSVDRKHNGTVTYDWNNWRPYDCGREYQYKVEEGAGYDGTHVSIEPTLNTWLDFTGTLTFQAGDTDTGFLFYSTNWDVTIREKVSAPAGGNDVGLVTLILEAEV